jgi:AraC-like DNA-binding protein
MDPIPTKVFRFSTDNYPKHKRIDAYREIYGAIARLDVEPIGDQPFHFDMTVCSLPGLVLASSVISPCRRSRGPQHLDGDDFLLGVSFGGGCIAHQWGREATAGEGEGVLMAGAEPGVVSIPSVGRHVSLRIPDSVLRSRSGGIDAWLCRTIPRSAAGLLLTGYVRAMWNAEALMQPDLRDVVVTHVYDLACLMLGAKGEARELAEQRGARAARREAILRAIESRSSDPALNAVTIALAHGITPRYVHLLLEETGKSLTHHVLERRLDKAATLLRDPRRSGRKIADIAVEAGFTDLSYFNRTFRRRFGATPTDIRHTAGRRL